MPWNNTPEKRRRDALVYADPVYLKNRRYALRRANGACEKCGTRSRPLQADHIVPVTQGGTHDPENLQVLCSGPGSCHAAKSASEGGDHGRGKAQDPAPRQGTRW